jgi:hypothetical protein
MTVWHTRISCWVPKAINVHTLGICNIYCFSPAKMVARMHLNVNVVCALSVLLNFMFSLRLWNFVPLLFIVKCISAQTSSNHFDIYLYSNKLHSIDIFHKQHIKIFVLSKTLKTSPTCFGHYLTIIREILYLS